MKLSTRGRYGTRLMLELAASYGRGPITISEVSRKQKIPVKYLEQLIIPLKKANLIKSVRGPKGGHMLSKSPDKINLWDLIPLLESKSALVDCLADEAACENSSKCLVRPIWGKAMEAMTRVFKETTLEELLRGTEEGESKRT